MYIIVILSVFLVVGKQAAESKRGGNCLILHSQQAAVEGEGEILVTSPVSVAWL